MAHITSDIFERLESGDKQTVEDVKQTLREHFGRGKDGYNQLKWENYKSVNTVTRFNSFDYTFSNKFKCISKQN